MKKIVILFVFLNLFQNLCQSQDPTFITKDSINKGISIINGWKYIQADSIQFADTVYNDGHWKNLSKNFFNEISHTMFGGGNITDVENNHWFRVKIKVDTSVINVPLEIYFMNNDNRNYEVYIDGKLYNKYLKDTTHNDDEDAYKPSPEYKFIQNGVHTIAIKHFGSKVKQVVFLGNNATTQVAIRLRFALSINNRDFNKEKETSHNLTMVAIEAILAGFFFALFMLHLFLFLHYRNEVSNIYFSIYQFCYFLIFLQDLINTIYKNPAGYIFHWTGVYAIPAAIIFLLLFLYSLFYDKKPKLFWVILILNIAYLVFRHFNELVAVILVITIFITAGIQILIIVIKSIRQKKDGARIMGIGILTAILFPIVMAVCVGFVIIILETKNQMYFNFGFLKEIGVLLFGLLCLVPISVSMSIILSRKFANNIKSLEIQLNENKLLSEKSLLQEKEKQEILEQQNIVLEEKVIQRTSEVVAQKAVVEQKNIIIEKQKTDVENSFKQLEIINSIGNQITSSLNVISVMDKIYQSISGLMDISFFFISAYNENNETVEIKYCVKEGKIVQEVFKTSVLNPDSYTAWTIKNKSEIVIADQEKERKNYLSSPSQLHGKEDIYTDTIIFIPLLIKDKIIGLYSVQSVNKNAYTKAHIDILRSLATVIAISLNNADSYNKLDNANVEISKQKAVVEQKNREITDSINYALRLQTAILPPTRIIKQYLQNSFILYKPKDIVAGDFYWMENVQFENLKMSQFENLSQKVPSQKSKAADLQPQSEITNPKSEIILFAACDCTGHGVPGAMVSVVCHNALNRAVREFGLTKPSEILDKTAQIVIENFSKSEEEIKDGMDISLVSLKYSSQNSKVEIEWAGANNPLWIVRNPPSSPDSRPSPHLEEIKANKQPIGKTDVLEPFTNHTIELNAGDTIYIFTDGFADQFSPADKKLMKKKFKEILISINHLPMDEQKNYLNNYIQNWQGIMEQTDDILVMGVSV